MLYFQWPEAVFDWRKNEIDIDKLSKHFKRIKEIGIKKSIGASSFDILLDFLSESVIISVIGTISGIISAVIIIKIGAMIYNIDIHITAVSVCISILLSVLFGTAFGIIPAYKASKYRPVDALRR